MNVEEKILEIAAYTIPAIVTGGVAFVLMQKFFNNEENKRKFEIFRETRKQSLPIKLQAYERMVLFLERINPVNIVMRISPNQLMANDYATLLIHHIQTEFEHNLAQQIYVSSEAWETVVKAKNSIVTYLRKTAIDNAALSDSDFRTIVLQDGSNTENASVIAIEYLKQDLKNVF